MKRLLAISISIFAFCSIAWADGVLDAFSTKAASSYVTFDFSYELKADIAMNLSGKGEVFGNSFHIITQDLEIWCDGSKRWIVDPIAKEVIVESISSSEDVYAMNPALFITNASKSFNLQSSGNTQFKNKSYHRVVLVPKSDSTIETIKLYFNASELQWAQVESSDGSINEFELKNIKFDTDGKLLKFDTSSLDDSWIVTDMSDF